MQKILRLCLWQVLFISISCFSLPISAEESGIRIRGPKASDAFPYDRYGPITGKDTLWNIALKVRPDPRFSVYQVMQALFETNPDAFKENNFNHMVSGQYLKIPTIDVIRAINPEIAQQKSRQDDQMWQKKVVKVAAKKPQTPAQISVNKQDLEAAKSEINVQLQAIDSTQQQRLATIQNDVLDSIDGLQSLLKENEALRQRLGRFNDQLDVMQQEVAKGKEIKLQMDNMLALQQELLAKAEAREQALLLAKQKAELEQNSLMSSAWFVALMATLPAVLVLSIIAWLWRKRASKTHDNDNKDSKAPAAPAAETENKATAVADNDEDKLALDDDLDLGDELTLDDELAIDLSEIDDADEDLFSDSLDSADDDVIALDDDLDDLDDLEDISLDTIALDESLEEDDVLEGGQLNQDDLDSLFAGLEDEPSEDEQDEAIIASPEQSALADEADESTVVPENAVEDIDALLDAASEEVDSAASFAANQDEGNNNADQPEISDPDDIDALLDVASEEVENAESLADNQKDDNNADQQEISDPDDIDALLDAIGTTSADDSKQDNDASLVEDSNEDEQQEISDPDDIDALLDAIGTTSADDSKQDNDASLVEDSNKDEQQEISDPDDIDALLDAIGTTSADDSKQDNDASLVEDSNEDEQQEVSDPDDIDALLDAIGTTSADDSKQDNDASLVEDSNEDEQQEVSDPDDIDALLDAIGTTSADDSKQENDVSLVEDSNEDVQQEVSDPDDIDALLDAIGTTSADDSKQENDASLVEDSNEDVQQGVSDPDDIDALLDVDNDDEAAATSNEENTHKPAAENSQRIDNFTDEYVQSFIDTDFSELRDNEAGDEATNLTSASEETSLADDFDIDALIDEVNQDQQDDTALDLDIGDELLDTDLANEAQSEEDSSVIDDETLAALSGDFDESTLAQLLDEEKAPEGLVDNSLDFNDSTVLADLLADDLDGNIEADEAAEAPKDNVEEAEGIKELDNLDFDDLLANIEQETQSDESQRDTADDDFEIGDDFEFENIEPDTESNEQEQDKDFISVDDLLSDSLLDDKPTEPYEKMNIDVGLGEFPEFAGDLSVEDIDDDEQGMAAKLDLAKVYIEIGDYENAEVILQDVVKAGDAQQQYDAQQLLDNLPS